MIITILYILLLILIFYSQDCVEGFGCPCNQKSPREFCSDYKKRMGFGKDGCNFIENQQWKKHGGRCPIGYDFDVDCPAGCRYWVDSSCPELN